MYFLIGRGSCKSSLRTLYAYHEHQRTLQMLLDIKRYTPPAIPKPNLDDIVKDYFNQTDSLYPKVPLSTSYSPYTCQLAMYRALNSPVTNTFLEEGIDYYVPDRTLQRIHKHPPSK